jgi:hypothetical protein
MSSNTTLAHLNRCTECDQPKATHHTYVIVHEGGRPVRRVVLLCVECHAERLRRR